MTVVQKTLLQGSGGHERLPGVPEHPRPLDEHGLTKIPQAGRSLLARMAWD